MSGMICLCIVLILIAPKTVIFTLASISFLKYNLPKMVVDFAL